MEGTGDRKAHRKFAEQEWGQSAKAQMDDWQTLNTNTFSVLTGERTKWVGHAWVRKDFSWCLFYLWNRMWMHLFCYRVRDRKGSGELGNCGFGEAPVWFVWSPPECSVESQSVWNLDTASGSLNTWVPPLFLSFLGTAPLIVKPQICHSPQLQRARTTSMGYHIQLKIPIEA